MAEVLDTHQRALRINLDPAVFGTFAEIGAGQEVARWFLQVGGASGTVAKTISAYDMKFSDAIYGKGARYVSRDRLLSMLDHEYTLLHERLDATRGSDTQFFVFADTAAARNYAGTNECHAWMGMRFQPAPRSEPSDVLLHVNMLDPTNLLQQQALGILGVNLAYASLYERDTTDGFLREIFANLSMTRLEIDVLDLRGPAFSEIDARRIGVRLVREAMAGAVLFNADTTLAQPSEVLRKHPTVIERGMFEHLSPLHHQMLESACAELRSELHTEHEPLAIPELSVTPVAGRDAPDEPEALRRLSDLFALERPVLLTRFPEVYHLTSYLRRYTEEPVRFVLGASTLVQILHGAHYAHLMGGVLEALGRLLAENVKIYVYPMEYRAFGRALTNAGITTATIADSTDDFATAETIRLDPPVAHLYRYLLEAGWIVGLQPPA